MESLDERLAMIKRHIDRAAEATRAPGVSPVLAAVVQEFQRKSEKLRTPGAGGALETIVEVEQAGDSAKVAAAADPGAGDDLRKLVGIAHDSICLLKHEQVAAR